MLKTSILLKKSIFKQLKVSNSKINKFGIGNNNKFAKKLKKLKGQNLFKS